MKDSLISFRDMPWEHPAPGLSQKISSDGANRIRLVRIDDQFVEEDWCEKGHNGYVVAGEMMLQFDGETRNFQAGDGLSIKPGKAFRHKAIIQKGKFVELILFESEH